MQQLPFAVLKFRHEGHGIVTYAPSFNGKVAGCVLAGLILMLPVGCTISLLTFNPYFQTYPRFFSSSSWKAADISSAARCGMLTDLEYRVGLVGRSREGIAALLGPADDRGDDETLSYWALCPSFLDVWVLEIRWHGGRAAEFWVRDT